MVEPSAELDDLAHRVIGAAIELINFNVSVLQRGIKRVVQTQ